MKIGTCSKCSYWCSTPGFETGDCHRHSPDSQKNPAAGVAYITLFPPVRATNWCGDFHFIANDEGEQHG